MALLLSKLQSFRVYKNNGLVMPYDDKNKLRGNMIVMMTPNEASSVNLINNGKFKNLNYHQYFIERNINEKPASVMMRKIITTEEQSDYLKRMKEACPEITRTMLTFESYDMNVFVDLHRYNEVFYEKTKFKGKKLSEQYNDYLIDILNRYKTDKYKKVTMYIPVNDWVADVKNRKEFSSRDMLNNPVTFMYHWLFFDYVRVFKLLKEFNPDLEFVFYSSNFVFKFNVKDVGPKTHLEFKKCMLRLDNSIIPSDPMDEAAPVEDVNHEVSMKVQTVKNDIIKKVAIASASAFTGSLPPEVEARIDEIASNKESESDIVDDDFNNDEKLKILMNDYLESSTTNQRPLSARDKMLKEKQSSVVIQGRTLDDVIKRKTEKLIESDDFALNVINKNVSKNRFKNFSKKYNEQNYERDVVQVFDGFKDKSVPFFITDVQKEDSSTAFDLKETWILKCEDANRQRFTLKVDMPIFVDDAFMYLNGNKKNIVNQFILKPVSKTGPDTVQICTFYNKIFMTRHGVKMAPKTERIKKIISKYIGNGIKVENGDNRLININYMTTFEYDDLGTSFIRVFVKDTEFVFNQDKIRDQIKTMGLAYDFENPKIIPVGIKNRQVIVLDNDMDVIVGTDLSLADYIMKEMEVINPDIEKEIGRLPVGKKYLHTRVKVMAKSIPLIMFLTYKEGLAPLLKKADINVYFTDKTPRLEGNDKNNKGIVEFADGYLVYDRYPIQNSLLMNGIEEVPTKAFNFNDFNGKDVYVDIFDALIGSRSICGAFDNFYDLLIDPVSKEVLDELNIPSDFTGLLLYANKLLIDNAFMKENNMNLYRIRNNEIVVDYMYKTLAKEYERYRSASANGVTMKFSIPQDAVIKAIQQSQIVEDYSTLNPIQESEKLHAITFKGPSGMNMDRAFTLEKRSYDKSMLGILGMSSPPSASVGVVRQLSLDTNIVDSRGFVSVTDDVESLNSMQLLTTAEMLTPFSAIKDDAPRTAMMTTQSKHTVPVKKASPVLVGNGVERLLPYTISNDFAFKAKEDGKVIERNDEMGVMIIQYKSGKKDFVNTNTKIAKNGGGGFYISNKLEPQVKLGQSFKKNTIVAKNTQFFSENAMTGETAFNMGTLAKVAIMGGYYTYEDSCIVSRRLCDAMTTYITMRREVIIGKNSNVSYIVKKGDSVQDGDPLIIFDNSFDESEVNKFLASLSDETAEDLRSLGRVPKKAKYSGVIEDIVIYYTVDEEELSPTLKKLITTNNAKIKKVKDLVKKHVDNPMVAIEFPPDYKTETKYGKIKGVDVGDGVYIEFYIKREDVLGVGDKMTDYSALKAVVCEVFPEGKEPYSEFRPDEIIDSFLGPISIQARMVCSVETIMLINKVLIELKRSCAVLYNG